MAPIYPVFIMPVSLVRELQCSASSSGLSVLKTRNASQIKLRSKGLNGPLFSKGRLRISAQVADNFSFEDIQKFQADPKG